MAALQVELVSPERILFSGEADMVIARTVGGGDIAFLPGHAPFVGALDIATLTIRTAGPSGATDELVAVHGGFIEVSTGSAKPRPLGAAAGRSEGVSSSPAGEPSDSSSEGEAVTHVTILSDAAEMSSEIDEAEAQRAKEAAEEKLRHGHDAQAEAEARRAHVRLAVVGAT